MKAIAALLSRTLRGATLLLLLAGHATASPQAGPSPASLKELTVEQLGEVIVTSVSKAPEQVWQTPAAITVLTHDDIVRAGVTTIPDLLRLIPGVEVARIDTSRNWVVGIRGFGDQFSKSVLVLLDGRSVYTPLWAGVHWPILDTVLDDIDRIEIIRGPGGTVWGANAENGVINIITKSAADTHGAAAEAVIGNVERALGTVRFGGGAGAVDFRGYVKGTNRQPQFHRDRREYDTWHMGQTGGRVDWRGGRDELTVTGDFYVADLGESVRVSTFAPPASFLVDRPVDLHGANLLARWRRTFTAASHLSVHGYWDHTYRLGTDFGERRDTFDIDVIHQWQPAQRHNLIWGAGARRSPGRVIQTLSFSDFKPHDRTLNLASAFAQDTVAFFDSRLAITGGVKLEHNSYTGVETQPSARALWRLSERHSLWGGVTRAVRIPSRVDEDISVTGLLSAPGRLYAVISGNPRIEAERVIGSEVGYRGLMMPTLYVDVTAFHNRYDHLLDLATPTTETRTTDGLTYTALVVPWVNAIKGRTRGVEIAPDWEASESLRLRGTYSFVDIDLTERPGTLANTLPTLQKSTPRHQATLQALVSLPRRVQVDPVYRYVSSRLSIPAYHTADLHIGVPLSRGFELSLVGQHLLQSHHAEWARDPGPTVEIRRSIYLRVAWRR